MLDQILQSRCSILWVALATLSTATVSVAVIYLLKTDPILRRRRVITVMGRLKSFFVTRNMPSHLHCIGMKWDDCTFKKIWKPALLELELRYYRLIPGTTEISLAILNSLFALQVGHLAYQTWWLVRLGRKTEAKMARIVQTAPTKVRIKLQSAEKKDAAAVRKRTSGNPPARLS